jgi:L-ascorbate metabolism protein UlaG (beta-lactamase superfamily)
MMLFLALWLIFFVNTTSLKLSFRFLESNSWEVQANEVKFLIDPVMDQLDFGIPSLYSGRKKVIDGLGELKRLSSISDFVLISQGFDDHAHRPTLNKIRNLRPDMPYFVAPNAVPILQSCGIPTKYITTITHGQKQQIIKKENTLITISATKGALLGPPWAEKENGYLIQFQENLDKQTEDKSVTSISNTQKKTSTSTITVYYEPHGMFDPMELKDYSADIVITPIVSQELPGYTLVAGESSALQLIDLLKARYLLPMANGELEQSGILSSIIAAKGNEDEFRRKIQRRNLQLTSNQVPLTVLSCPAGKEITIPSV